MKTWTLLVDLLNLNLLLFMHITRQILNEFTREKYQVWPQNELTLAIYIWHG